jgi:hypothetical protein
MKPYSVHENLKKTITMSKKLTAICFVLALIMQSCSTGNMFSHKHYGHLNWIDHKTKVETNGKGLEAESAQKEEKSIGSPVSKHEVDVNHASSQEEVNTTNLTEVEPEIAPEYPVGPTKDIIVEESAANQSIIIEKHEENSVLKPYSAVKELKEKSTSELLLMALLIALIVLLFWLLPGVGYIIGLVLVIFLILVLLRYFGVI